MEQPTLTGAEGPASPSSRRVDYAAEILAYLWSRWRFIAKFMGIAMLVFVVVLLVIPKRYKAEATVIILPPRFVSDVRAETLSVTTARSILDTAELKQSIIDRIRRVKPIVDQYVAQRGEEKGISSLLSLTPEEMKKVLPEEETAGYLAGLTRTELQAIADWKKADIDAIVVDDLARALESEEVIEKKTAADVKMAPLIRLYAKADTGQKAQLLANTWASVFEAKYDTITTQKTQRQYESIAKQQKQSQVELQDMQTTIVQFKGRHNLELYQRLIDEYSEDFRSFTGQLVQKESAMRSSERKLDQLYRVANSLERDGEWIGKVNALASYDSGETSPAAASEPGGAESDLPVAQPGQPYSTSAPVVSDLVAQRSELTGSAERGGGISRTDEREKAILQSLRSKALESKSRLESAIHEMRGFYSRYPLSLMQKGYDQMQSELLDAESRMRVGSVRLDVLRKSLATLDAQLTSTPQFIEVIKDVPDISIANAFAEGRRGDLQSLPRLTFRRQEINPVWSDLIEQRTKLDQEYELTRNDVEELKGVVPAKEVAVRRLLTELQNLSLFESSAKENLAGWQRANRELSDSYVDTQNDIHNTARQLALLTEEVKHLEGEASKTKALAEEYQQRYNEAAATLQLLESRQRALQRNTDLLLQKLQDAQLAVRQEMSDVSIAANAVAPQKHYFPKRSILLVVLTLVTFALLCGVLGREKFMELRTA